MPRHSISHQPSTATPSTPPSPQPSTLRAFDQQPGESDKAFAAFSTYLALGPTRSLAKAGAAMGRKRQRLAKLSKRWQWVDRARAYQLHLDAVQRQAAESVVSQKTKGWSELHEHVRQQAWSEAADLIILAEDLKARWRGTDRLPGFDAIIRALDLAFRLKQFAAGMPSQVKELNTTVTGKLDLDWEIALRNIYGPKPSDPQPAIDVESSPSTPAPAPAPTPPQPNENQDTTQPNPPPTENTLSHT